MNVNNLGKKLLNKGLAAATLPLWDLGDTERKWERRQVNSIRNFLDTILDSIRWPWTGS